uniref:Uncharacterized protein n=1 Tax=Panagrolaimus sp. PS1159 TaxID=55785 RepID=A0AC35ER14_9BILA
MPGPQDRILEIKRYCTQAISPYFCTYGFTSNILSYAMEKVDHIMGVTCSTFSITEKRLQHTLFIMMEYSVRQILIYDISHRDSPLTREQIDEIFEKQKLQFQEWNKRKKRREINHSAPFPEPQLKFSKKMITKDEFLLTKNRNKSFKIDNTDNGNQYSNLNLNQINKYPILNSVQSNSKSYIDKNYDSTIPNHEKAKLNTWNKFPSYFTTRENKTVEEEIKKKLKKSDSSNTKNDSTLSLHIKAYENSIKSVAFDSICNKNGELKKKKLSLNKQHFPGSFIHNSFEFPRQQEEDQRTESEVMEFKANQKLLDPNRPIESKNDQVSNAIVKSFPAQIPNITVESCAQFHQRQQDSDIQQPPSVSFCL